MTQTPQLLGAEYDSPADLPQDIGLYPAKRDLALAGMNRAEKDGEAAVSRVLKWELGIHDIIIAPADGVSPYRGASYDKYAEYYGLAPETVDYALERAKETRDVILRARYLEFASLQSKQSGRAWIERQRELLRIYREYVDTTFASLTPDAELVGVHIDQALTALGRILAQGGVVGESDAPEWAAWILGIAERSRDLPQKDDFWRQQQRHRWIADYLVHLTELPVSAIAAPVRTRALELLADAAAYYGGTPLNENFAMHVAEVDASMRKYFGESGTHEKMIRAQVAALEGRAKFHEDNGQHALSIAHFKREALRVVTEHRQYFTDDDVARLSRGEQAAINQAVANEEFAKIRIPISIPIEDITFLGVSAENTVANLVRESVGSVPRFSELEADAKTTAVQAPLSALIPRTVMGPGKVVGEAQTEEENLALDIEQQIVIMARILGAAIALTVDLARESVGLSASDLTAPFQTRELEQGTVDLLTHGCERFVAGDFISAAHILVPRIEDVLRQRLQQLGVDTTKFRLAEGRTDDATLGRLLTATLPDGRKVREWMGEDLWNYLNAVYASQTGLNLRHEFAHGLARPHHCSAGMVGLVLSLLYVVATRA